MSTKSGTFDFTPINNVTRGLTSGMKLAVAKGLINSVKTTMEKFDNECVKECQAVSDALSNLQESYKKSNPNYKG